MRRNENEPTLAGKEVSMRSAYVAIIAVAGLAWSSGSLNAAEKRPFQLLGTQASPGATANAVDAGASEITPVRYGYYRNYYRPYGGYYGYRPYYGGYGGYRPYGYNYRGYGYGYGYRPWGSYYRRWW